MALVSEVDEDDIKIPPSQPESGLPILAHKLWVGNIDKRITELVNLLQIRARDPNFKMQETACKDPVSLREDTLMEVYVTLQRSKSG